MKWIILFAVLLGADAFTKQLALKYDAASFNPGIAFSIPVPNIVMVIATPLLLFVIFWIIRRSLNMKHPIAKMGMILLLAGGIGNFITRLRYGAVIDFIDFHFWPSFNFADAYLTIAAFLFILFYSKIMLNNYGSRK